jgi:hypothetical protein
MRRGLLRTVGLGLILLAPSGLSGEEKPTRLETARWAAELNGRSAAGRDWMQRSRPTIDKLITPVLSNCLPEDGEEVTAFSIFVRLSREGRVREVLTDLDDSLGSCMTAGSRELRLPEAPRDDYWIQLNLAAPL